MVRKEAIDHKFSSHKQLEAVKIAGPVSKKLWITSGKDFAEQD